LQEKKEVEGSLFVFERTESPRYGFFLMNRISIENIMELVTPDMKFKYSEPYLLYRNPLGMNVSCGDTALPPVRQALES
jgi:mRNA-decapping enzyme 1B